MPTWHYSVQLRDESKIAKAVRYDIPVSIKYMREVTAVLRGMKLKKAIELLENVIKLKEPIPFRRYHGKVSHKRGLADKYGWPAGRYPVKAARYLLELLRNVEANAENKGLDADRLVIIHIAAHKGVTLKRYMPRAFGRATPKFRRMTNVEVIVKEVG
ncbi:50S ribosomal protein L22 [Thermogladius sp. 4427co]|uniref:50S ribosomal protein L22 n=1 Tax=Thermogladius sp. 4427co TaxID=3450718 RepID=UPI003F79A118